MPVNRAVVALVFVSLLAISSLPQSAKGVSNGIPIKHVIIMMEENHSFDNYFGTYPGANGINLNIGLPKSRASNELVRPFHINGTLVPHDLCHDWECEHEAYDNGKMDGFVYAMGSNLTMGYFDNHQIPYYWDYASRFVLFDNFYSSIMASSVPNHLYLVAGQSGGVVKRTLQASFTFPTIVDELDQNHVSWKYYTGGHSYLSGWNPLPGFASFQKNQSRMNNLAEPSQFYQDIASNTLPEVVWIMPTSDQESEHPPYDVSLGERNVVSMINAVSTSKHWNSTAIFLTWDESGGWYDHVPPPQVDRYGYGFRVPCLLISPFAKQGYVDHTQADFASLLKFMETAFSLPPLTDRDRSANNLLEAFNFSQTPIVPLILPGPYVVNQYPLIPRQNNTKLSAIGPRFITSTTAGSRNGQKLPDVAVTTVSIDPMRPNAGDDITVTYTLKNLGDGDAQAFSVALYHNRTTGNHRRIQTSATLSLKAGASMTLSFPRMLKATGGVHTLTVIVNDLNQLSEGNSSDNAMSKTYFVQSPRSSANPITTSTVTSYVTTSVAENNGLTTVSFIGLVVLGNVLLSFLLGIVRRFKNSTLTVR